MKVLRTREDPVTGEIYKIVGEERGNPVSLEYLESMGIVKKGTCKLFSELENKNEDTQN